MRLSSSYSDGTVGKLLASKDTCELAEFLRERHEERYFQPLRLMRDAAGNEAGYGFAMMSLCCLLIETFQCYREGLPTTSGKEWEVLLEIEKRESVPTEYSLEHIPQPQKGAGEAIFKKFFKEPPEQKEFFPNVDGEEFYKSIRCGLLHQALTKNNWTINKTCATVCDPNKQEINRDLFAEALIQSFAAYLTELRSQLRGDALWKNAATKIWWLVRISKKR